MKTAERSLKALANRRRLAIVVYLERNGEATIADLAEDMRAPYKTVAWNTRKLLMVDILDQQRRGPFVYYRLAFHPRGHTVPLRAILTFVRKSE